MGGGFLGDAFFELFYLARVLGFETFEFGGDAGLDVEFEVFGAGAVGLGTAIIYQNCDWRWGGEVVRGAKAWEAYCGACL